MADQGLREYLAQLEAQRAAINIQIAGARAALELAPEEGAAATAIPSGAAANARRDAVPGRIRPAEFFRMSIPEAIKAYLEIMKQPQAPKAIVDGLKAGGVLSEAKHFYANVFTALKRLKAGGAVVNTKTGGWGLADWYAGRSGAGIAEKPKGKRKPNGKKKGAQKGGAKSAKAATKAASPKTKQAGSYNAFVAEHRPTGKSMKEIGAMWRKKKAEGG